MTRAARVLSFAVFFLLLAGTASPAAPAAPPAAAAAPVEISAAKSLDWNRREKTYTARDSVVVKQGAATLTSDLLVARYDDSRGAAALTTLEARGNVTLSSPPYTASGDSGVYDVRTGQATLTGGNLKIVTAGGETLTAQERIEFFSGDNRLTASGGATAVSGDNRLTADTLSAFFAKDAQGKTVAERITARGHVLITTARETVSGDEGSYDLPAQTAVLTGKVRIRQGENWLEGTRADVDMATGISRLSGTGNRATDGRVKGMFFPKTMKSPPRTSSDATP